MKNNYSRFLFPLVILAVMAFILSSLIGRWGSDHTLLDQAQEYYQKGEKAQTVAERKDSFNQALKVYQEIEDKYHPDYGNGKLYYNLGNTYFQLEEYPRAIYYYERAKSLMPGNDRVQQNLGIALTKLQLPLQNTQSVFEKIFFLHYYLSLPDRLQAFFLTGTLVLFSLLGFIWFRKKWWKTLIALSSILFCFFMLSTLYTRFLTPVEGIAIKSALMYRDAGTQYAKVKESPLPAGTKVIVLRNVDEGKWFKIIDSDGTLGYVSQESFKLF